jgi:hypothetical protein
MQGFINTFAFMLYTHTPAAPCLRSSSRTHSLSRSYAGFHKYLCVYAVHTYTTSSLSSSRTHSLYSSYAGFHNTYAFYAVNTYTVHHQLPAFAQAVELAVSRSYAGFYKNRAFMLYTHAPTAPCLRLSSRTHRHSLLCRGFIILMLYTHQRL